MILEIIEGEHKIAVEIDSANGRKQVRMGGKEIFCDWVRLGEGHYSLILDGTVHDVHVSLSMETCDVSSRAGTCSFRIRDPRRLGMRDNWENGQSGLQRIYADMPGKVVRILVRGGDSVVYDQSLLVLEAMKMQNDIRAPQNGVVKEIAVQPGTTVNAGDLLAILES